MDGRTYGSGDGTSCRRVAVLAGMRRTALTAAQQSPAPTIHTMALRTAALVLGMVAVAVAFAPAAVPRSAAPASCTRLHAYVPEGLSAEQYKNIKAKEKVKNGGRVS